MTTTLYEQIDNNHQALIDLVKGAVTTLDVSGENIIDYDYRLIGQKRHPSISIPLPEYRPGEQQSTGLITYELIYKIKVVTDQVGIDRSRLQLQTIAYDLIELLENTSQMNATLDDTCTYSNVLGFNPNLERANSEKAYQRVGEINFITSHTFIRP